MEIIKLKYALPTFLLALAVGLGTSFFGEHTLPMSVATALERCPPSSQRTDSIVCFRQSVVDLVEQQGVTPVIAELTTLTQQRIVDPSQCHDLVHAVGQLGTELFSVRETLSNCTELCTYGCFHGAMESALSKNGTQDIVLDDLCRDYHSLEVSDPHRAACYHGLGHGVTVVSNYSFEGSLELCDQLNEYRDRVHCGEGVIMELFEPSSFDHPLLKFPDNIPRFCSELKPEYAEVCFRTAGVHDFADNQSITQALETCNQVPKDLTTDCVAALSQNMFFILKGDSQDLINFCLKAQVEHRKACVQGVLHGSELAAQSQKGQDFCSKLNQGNYGFECSQEWSMLK